jgi:hypothetical protein
MEMLPGFYLKSWVDIPGPGNRLLKSSACATIPLFGENILARGREYTTHFGGKS